MSDQPFDPAANKTQTEKYEDTDTFAGQQGYDVEFEDGQYQNEELQDVPPTGRSGSYEQSNLGRKTIHELDSDVDMADAGDLPPGADVSDGQSI